MAEQHTVKFWRGNRATYNELGSSGKLDYWTRYSVTETDGRRTEYFGYKPVNPSTGELYPVIDVVSTLPTLLNVGDRYLVGHDKTETSNAEYYVVEIAANLQQTSINPLGVHSVRIQNKKMRSYVLVDGILTTYDGVIDCGTF